jgi:hypothetical protein
MRIRKERKRKSLKFLELLKQKKPDLHARALELNTRDNFVMWKVGDKQESSDSSESDSDSDN